MLIAPEGGNEDEDEEDEDEEGDGGAVMEPLWSAYGGEARSHFTECVFKIAQGISNIHRIIHTEQAHTHTHTHAHTSCMAACTWKGRRGSLLRCWLFLPPPSHSLFLPRRKELLSSVLIWPAEPRAPSPTGCWESKARMSQERSSTHKTDKKKEKEKKRSEEKQSRS